MNRLRNREKQNHILRLLAAGAAFSIFSLLFASSVRAAFPRWWSDQSFHQQQVGFVMPVPQSGVKRVAYLESETRKSEPVIVSGTVIFTIRAYGGWNTYEFPADQLRYRYILHTPDGNGNDIRTPLSGILVGPQTISWDSSSIPDGTYAVSVKLLGGGSDPENAVDRYKRIPLTVIVDNQPGAVTGQQWLPLIGYMGYRSRWAESFAVDWIRSAETPLLPAARPYPYGFITPPQTDAARQALVGDGKFFGETWLQVYNFRYDPEGRLSQTKEGHRFIVGYHESLSAEKDFPLRFPFTDGKRNQASLNKHTAFRPDPAGPGFIGVSYEGRLFRIHPSEGITTLAGHATRSDIVPYSPWDKAGGLTPGVSLAEFEANQWRIAGSFDTETRFWQSTDLAVDPDNPNIVYISDAGNHVIRKVDLSGAAAQINTFAGTVGQAGHQNGSANQALFNHPRSVEFVGRIIYVADYGNNALRAINLETSEVTTVIDSSQITKPFWIRRFSNGDLALSEMANRSIRRIRPATGTILNTIIDHAHAKPFDVDWHGMVGPVDHIIAAGNYDPRDPDDHAVSRITPQGEFSYVAKDWGLVRYQSEDGAYAISVAIDDNEPRIIQTGQYQWGVHVFRPVQPNDPLQDAIDIDLSDRGRDHYIAGTIREFYPNGNRPSFAALHGRKGHNYISQLNFDDMIGWSDGQLAQYIRDGMGGQVPRPELTGKDLQAIIYFIRVHSLQGKTEVIDAQEIAENLKRGGHWDNLDDVSLPEFSNISVSAPDSSTRIITFNTNEPTMAIAHYGRTIYNGLNSKISNAFSMSHSITLSNLDSNHTNETYYQLRIKDQAGHQRCTADRFLTPGTHPVTDCTDNYAPLVSAGPDRVTSRPDPKAELNGSVADDGNPDPPKKVTVTWSKVSGPGDVVFADKNAVDTQANFVDPGVYLLRLTASDSELSSSDEMKVTVKKSPAEIAPAPPKNLRKE